MTSSTAFDRILDALRANGNHVIQRSDTTASAQCPAHDDRNPSLSIAVRDDRRGIVLKCHAGCEHTDVLAALGMTPRDTWDDPEMQRVHKPNQDYHYAKGGVKYRRQSAGSPDKRMHWKKDTPDDSLYKVDRLQAEPTDTAVYVTEGEKGCDAIWAMGFPAVSTGGATRVRTCDLEPLRDRDIIAIVDRDRAGLRWGAELRDKLAGISHSGSATFLQCAVDIDKADVVEHFDSGLTLAELVPCYLEPPVYIDNGGKHNGADIPAPAGWRERITWANEIPPKAVPWVWVGEPIDASPLIPIDSTARVPESMGIYGIDSMGRIAAGTVAIAAGPEGVGKSSFGIWMTARVSTGTLRGAWYGKPQAVLYCAVEDSWQYTIVPRLMAAGADLSRVGRFDVVSDSDEVRTLTLPSDNEMLKRAVIANRVALVVMDPLLSLITDRLDSHHERETRVALDPLAAIAETTGTVLLGIAHWTKTGTDVTTRITGSGAFKNLPRAVFAFARDPDAEQEFIFTQTKNSLGRHDLPSVRYTIESARIEVDGHAPFYTGKFVALGNSNITVGDVLASRDSDVGSDSLTPAQRFIIRYVGDHADADGEVPAAECITAGEPVGYEEPDLVKARGKIRNLVSSKRTGFGAQGRFMWFLTPEGLQHHNPPQPEPEPAQPEPANPVGPTDFHNYPTGPDRCDECGFHIETQWHRDTCSQHAN
jgi:hypothetical protein